MAKREPARRTMVTVAQCLGLRVSEVVALQWQDINFDQLTMRVTRAAVNGIVDDVKSEYSEDDLPLDPDLATVLLTWKRQCPDSVEGWVFPSKITGRCYHASPIQQDYIRPAGQKLGLETSDGTRSAIPTARGSIRWGPRSACSRNSCGTRRSRPR